MTKTSAKGGIDKLCTIDQSLSIARRLDDIEKRIRFCSAIMAGMKGSSVANSVSPAREYYLDQRDLILDSKNLSYLGIVDAIECCKSIKGLI